MNNDARVVLWGSVIGAITWLDDREIGVFQYAPDFLASNIQLSPIMMPLEEFPYEFPALARNTFRGLPGLLADSLPDRYGNAIIDAWLASQGRTSDSFHPVERLCYVGTRGMGALEFQPATFEPAANKHPVNVGGLVDLANRVLDEKASLGGVFSGRDDHDALTDILRVGTSAGGARAKAVLAWNRETGEFRSGQVDPGEPFEHWLMKFDGVTKTGDPELSVPQGYGQIEYAYHLMARAAGIVMTECRLHKEADRNHFMTKRFDRTDRGGKVHMQSLGAIAHFDYKQRSSYSYEQAIQVMRRLDLPQIDVEQLLQRAIFNVVARNCDDHVKNLAFLMDRRGQWRLSPAYDVTYAWDTSNQWTRRHQMSINGQRERFERNDLLTLASNGRVKNAVAHEMVDTVIQAVRNWPAFAAEAGVAADTATSIGNAHLTNL
jgi:serine/threonine-protein kinase HipA